MHWRVLTVAELCAVTEAGMSLSPFSKHYLEKLPLQATLQSEGSLISFRLRTPGGGGGGHWRRVEEEGTEGTSPAFPQGLRLCLCNLFIFPTGSFPASSHGASADDPCVRGQQTRATGRAVPKEPSIAGQRRAWLRARV